MCPAGPAEQQRRRRWQLYGNVSDDVDLGRGVSVHRAACTHHHQRCTVAIALVGICVGV